MRNLVKWSLGVVLALSGAGGWWFIQQRQYREIPILMYHRVGNDGDSVWWVHNEDFEQHMAFLRAAGYRSILPADLVAHRRWGKPLPAKPVIITFDDGYLCVLQNAEPLLKKYGFRGIVYLVTGRIGQTEAERQSMEGVPLLVWPEVRAMHRRGTLTFGGHTHTHANLLACADAYAEISGCYRDILRYGGFKPGGFCYPNGQYRAATIATVKRAGFTTAVTCHADFVRTGSTNKIAFFELPRLSVYGGRHVYHVDVLPRVPGNRQLAVRVWKEGVAVPCIPRLATRQMPPSEGWLSQVRISNEPRVLVWDFPTAVEQDAVFFELWGDLKMLPHFRQDISKLLDVRTTAAASGRPGNILNTEEIEP